MKLIIIYIYFTRRELNCSITGKHTSILDYIDTCVMYYFIARNQENTITCETATYPGYFSGAGG